MIDLTAVPCDDGKNQDGGAEERAPVDLFVVGSVFGGAVPRRRKRAPEIYALSRT